MPAAKPRYVEVADRAAKRYLLGQKAGRDFYLAFPLQYCADAVGLLKVLECPFAKKASVFWNPLPLLEQLVAEVMNFSSLDRRMFEHET